MDHELRHLVTAISDEMGSVGGGTSEDGWDGIEHAIAEYKFDEGAVPIVVLVQADQGRLGPNNTLARDGVLAALRSKNVVLNSFVVGPLLVNGNLPTEDPQEPLSQPSGATFDWAPIFNLTPYGFIEDLRDIYVLGVEADTADGIADGAHSFLWFDTDTFNSTDEVPVETTSDALQVTYDGSNTGATGMVGTGKSVLIAKGLTDGIGPTAAGYKAKNVAFAFEDLINRGTGNPVSGATEITSVGDSHHLSTMALGSFEFSFFGMRDELYVHSDGYITFQSSTNYSTTVNADLSQAGGIASEPMIAVLWDDLADPGTPGSIVWQVKDSGLADERLIVQWEQMAYNNDDYTYDPITFQAVLYADGRIQFNYLDLDSYPTNNSEATIKNTGGVGATVGIWSGATDPITLPVGKFVPGPHSLQTDSSGETSDSYIRMAWDTGGAAWDVGVVDRFGATSDEANELREAFISNLVRQIHRADKTENVFHVDSPVLQLNVGGGTVGQYTSDSSHAPSGTWTYTPTVTIQSHLTNSLPGNVTDEVFETARIGDMEWDFDEMIVPNGYYVVELLLADLDWTGGTFDVIIEGRTVLNDYNIASDFARITTFSDKEHNTLQLWNDTPIAKRFFVEVSDGNGLQIDLIAETGNAMLNGLRILDGHAPIELPGDYNLDGIVNVSDYLVWRNTLDPGEPVTYYSGADGDGSGDVNVPDYLVWKANYGRTLTTGPSGSAAAMIIENQAPKVTNVIVSGSSSTHTPHSFDTVDGSGEQLRTVPVGGADTLSIVFSEDVDVLETDLDLVNLQTGFRPTVINFDYDVMSMTATWQFASWSAGGVYLVSLSDSVTDLQGDALDGEWINPVAIGTVNSSVSEFPSGNGTAGGDFNFAVSILPGDGNVDGVVSLADLLAAQNNFGQVNQTFTGSDFTGDGAVTGADMNIVTTQFGINVQLLWALPDLDGDYDVDEDDENILVGNYSMSNPTLADGDLDGDNDVDADDLDLLYTLMGLDIEVVG